MSGLEGKSKRESTWQHFQAPTACLLSTCRHWEEKRPSPPPPAAWGEICNFVCKNVLCCPEENVTLASSQTPLTRLHCPFPRLVGFSVSFPTPSTLLPVTDHLSPALPTLSPFNSTVPRENSLQVVSQQVGGGRYTPVP